MDDRTDHLDLPLPHPEHLMIEDVVRLREALVSLDAVVSRRAHDSVEIAAGAGLTGGGTLQQSRRLAVAFASQDESEAASASEVVMSPLRTAQAIEARLASEAEAQTGEAATRLMTPLRTRQVLDGQFLARLASQADAEAGEDDRRLMTPLRSHQAFDARLAARLATQQQAEAGLDSTQLMTPLRVAQFHALQPKGEIYRLARTDNVKLTAAEFGRFIDITSGTFTQTFDAAETLGNGWWCHIRNSGTGDITLAGPLVPIYINGNFDTDTNWTKGSGWIISNGQAVATSTAGNLTANPAPLISGRRYRLSFDLTVTGGSVRPYGGTTPLGSAAINKSGSYVFEFTANSAGLYFDGVTSFTGTIGNVLLESCDFIMYPGEVRLVQCDGTKLTTVVLSAFYKVFTTSGSFRKPPGYAGVVVEVIGGGAGGPGGSAVQMSGGSSGTRNGPAGGGLGPRRMPMFFASDELQDTSTVVVGAGGVGGTGGTTASPTGGSGGAGGVSSFISTEVLSSAATGVPEITGLRRCGTAGGKSGNVSYDYSYVYVTNGDPGSAHVSGTPIPNGGAGARVPGQVASGTYSATGTAGQSAAVAFCSGAGGGPAAARVPADLNGPDPLTITLTGGHGGQGGMGAGGGAGGNAVIVRGNGGGLTNNITPTYALQGGNGGNGGPGLVSIWGVI